jgi:hypothetical protein
MAAALVCVTIMALSQPLFAQSAAGRWETAPEGTAGRVVMEFKIDGTTLTGSLAAPRAAQPNQLGDGQPITGKVEGNVLAFSVPSPDGQRRISFVGEVQGNEITFTRDVTGGPGLGGGPGAGIFGLGGPKTVTVVRAGTTGNNGAQAAATAAPVVAERGSIRGVILRAGTTEGIDGADITISADRSDVSLALQSSRDTQKLPLYVSSDGMGRFNAENLLPGRYVVSVEREGFFDAPGDPVNGWKNVVTIPVTVTAKQQAEVSASMAPGAIIAGRVYSGDGRALSRIEVRASTLSATGVATTPKVVAQRTTNDRGEYRLFWLPPGQYFVSVGSEVGVVRSPVALDQTFATTFYPAASDMNGATPVAVKSGDELRGIDIVPRIATAADMPSPASRTPRKVSGTIVNTLPPLDPSKPAATVVTLLLLPHGRNLPEGITQQNVGTVNLTSSEGPFTIPALPQGSFDLYARIADPRGSQTGAGAINAWGRAVLEVRDRDLENVQVVIHASVDVPGLLLTNGTPGGSAGVKIGLRPEGSSSRLPNYQAVTGKTQTPKPDGTFLIPAVAEGDYAVTVDGLTDNAYVADIQPREFYLTDQPSSPIQVSVKTDGGTVQGVVRESDQNRSIVVATASFYKTVTADEQGRFTLRGIPPGNYKVFAVDIITALRLQNPEEFGKFESQGVAVTVAPSSTATIELTPPRQ